MLREKNLIERACTLTEQEGLPVWTQDEADPYQTIPISIGNRKENLASTLRICQKWDSQTAYPVSSRERQGPRQRRHHVL
jgi:hypothetical protein